MKPKIAFFIGVFALSFLLYSYKDLFLFDKKEVQSGSSDFGSVDPEVPKEGYQPEEKELPSQKKPEIKKESPSSKKSSGTQSFSVVRNEFWASVPSVKDVRAEVSKNPHSSPAQYGELAKSMAHLMEYGSASPAHASETFSVLSECVKAPKEQVPLAVRASCLKLAKSLTSKHTGLKTDYDFLHSSLEGRLKKHVAVMEKLEASLKK